jgi:hypothetical protein
MLNACSTSVNISALVAEMDDTVIRPSRRGRRLHNARKRFDDGINRGDVGTGIRVSEGAVIVIGATSGAEVGTEMSWGYCEEASLPRFIFVAESPLAPGRRPQRL